MNTEETKKVTTVQPVAERRDPVTANLRRKRTPEETAKFERAVNETFEQYDQALKNLAK